MQDADQRQPIEFRPRASNGQFWTAAIGAGTLALFFVPMIVARGHLPWQIIAALAVLAIAVTAPLFVVSWYFPRMRYAIDGSELKLTYGPLMNERIPIDSIRDVRLRQQLKISLLASFRFPGLALFDVEYVDERRVRMCATSASKQILLIETENRRYGVTPDDLDAFVSALLGRAEYPERIRVDLRPESSLETDTVDL